MGKLFHCNFFFPSYFWEANIGTWLHSFRVDLTLAKESKNGPRTIISIVFCSQRVVESTINFLFDSTWTNLDLTLGKDFWMGKAQAIISIVKLIIYLLFDSTWTNLSHTLNMCRIPTNDMTWSLFQISLELITLKSLY